MSTIFTVAILGCGSRGACYTKYMLTHPDKYKIVALCDPNPAQIKKMHELFGLVEALEFLDPDVFLKEKHADVLVISSPDREHVPQAVKGMELGYHLLLEKPVSYNRSELDMLLETQIKTGRKVVVCHELRYGKGYLKCKEILDSGRLGRLYAIDASERVAYWHWTQAYVKNIGASLKVGYPAILAKCSHDLDLIRAYAGSECESVSSVGELSFFKEENAPKDSADRCVYCKYVDTCPYSAKRIYVDGWHKAGEPRFNWPYNKVTLTVPLTEEALMKGITEGLLGKCVFKCSTDHVDHQFVQMNFKNGVKASLKMFYGAVMGRKYVFYCDRGELTLDERTDSIEIMPFGEEKEVIDISALVGDGQKGHGGGDAELVKSLYTALTKSQESTTSLKASIECHLMGIAAEESRHSHETIKVHK